MASIIRRENTPAPGAFSFADLERQGREIIARAEAEAHRLRAQAERQTQVELDARRRAAHERGLAEGRAAGLAQIRAEAREAALAQAGTALADLTRSLQSALAEYDRRRHALLAQAEAGLVNLAMAIARRVCRLQVRSSPEPARAAARALLELVAHRDDLELRVNPAEHDALRDVAAEFAQAADGLTHVRVVADPHVVAGGCVLRTRDGIIDADVERQLDRVAAAICGRDADEPDPPGAQVPLGDAAARPEARPPAVPGPPAGDDAAKRADP